jgi:pyruvate,water dikinase
MNQDLFTLVSVLRDDPGRAPFLDSLENCSDSDQLQRAVTFLSDKARLAWEEFMLKNGHSRTSWDVALPAWSESPRQMAPLLKSFLSSGSKTEKAPSDQSTQDQRRVEFFEELKKQGFLKAIPTIQKILLRFEDFIRMDEEQHFLSGLLLEPSKKLIVRGGELLVEKGVLGKKEHVFFLHLKELKEQLARPSSYLQFLANRRESEWQRSRSCPKPLELPVELVETANLETHQFQGVPVSPGQAIGPIHVVEHLEDIRGIPRGAVLVTTSPNPSLTAVYPLLSGMISVTGGPLSHGFIAAREYQLPAVSHVKNAAQIFPAGTWVKLDGTRGTVERIQAP